MAITDLGLVLSTSLLGFVKNFPASYVQETAQQLSNRWLQEYSYGNGQNQANLVSVGLRSAPAGGESVNLRTGTLLDLGGNACTFTKIKEFAVFNLGLVSGEDILLGGNFLISGSSEFIVGAGSPWCRAKGIFHIRDPFVGFDCNTASRDTFTAQGSGATISYALVVIGLD